MGRLWLFTVFLFVAVSSWATVYGTVRGVVHDPQHRPVYEFQVTLKARNSEYQQTALTDAAGQFHFDTVPLGEYTVAVSDAVKARLAAIAERFSDDGIDLERPWLGANGLDPFELPLPARLP